MGGVRLGYFLAFLMMMANGAAWAAPNAYDVLEARLQAAETRLQEIQQKIVRSRQQHAQADSRLRRSVADSVRLGQYPQGFWLVRSVMMNTPLQADIVAVMGRQQARSLLTSRAEVGALAELYGQATLQIEDLRQVRGAYAESRGNLLKVEQDVLRRAGLQAEALEQGMAEALKAPLGKVKPVVTAPPAVAGGLPVAGRVVRGFGSGEGAAKAGVVLRAPQDAPVRATQAAKVLFAGPFRHFGGLVIVKTVGGEDVLLGGMGTLNVNAGDDVAAGQQLGSVGEEGRIYWEVRRRGRVVNPL